MLLDDIALDSAPFLPAFGRASMWIIVLTSLPGELSLAAAFFAVRFLVEAFTAVGVSAGCRPDISAICAQPSSPGPSKRRATLSRR